MALNKKGGLGKGLGKGIDSLISNAYAVETKKKDSAADKKEPETTVKLRLVEPASSQPRLKFDEDTLTELAESIKKYGVALIENLQREDLNPIEEAKAYQSLIEKYQLKQEEIAEKVFKSRSVITNALRLLKLDEEVQLMLMEGQITNGHAKAILGLEDKEEQRAVAQKVVEEQLSVRDTEKYIKSLLDKKNEPAVTKPVLKNQTLYETLESRMKSRMGTKVQIKRKSDDKGKIEIDYYSNDDLERIIELMGITKDTIE